MGMSSVLFSAGRSSDVPRSLGWIGHACGERGRAHRCVSSVASVRRVAQVCPPGGTGLPVCWLRYACREGQVCPFGCDKRARVVRACPLATAVEGGFTRAACCRPACGRGSGFEGVPAKAGTSGLAAR